jgi:outer membrane protein insertion porin family
VTRSLRTLLRTPKCRSPLTLLILIAACTILLATPAGAQDAQCGLGDQEVIQLDFRGNRAFSDRVLASKISTTPSSWGRRILRLGGDRRCIDSAEVDRDVLRLRTYYRSRGYYEAQVRSEVIQHDDDAVRVVFEIVEGLPIRIDSLVVDGAAELPQADREAVLAGLDVRVGDPFDRERLDSTVAAARTRLWNRGYPRADVLRSYEVRAAERSATLEINLVPGRRTFLVQPTLIVHPADGRSQQISDAAVRRIIGFSEGDLYRENQLLAAQRALFQTGAYRFVDVRIAPDSLQPLADSLIRVEIELREDLMRQVDAEVGWATLDCFRARGVYTDKSLFGDARRLDVTAQTSKIGYGHPVAFARSLCRRDILDRDVFSDTLNYFVGATLRQPRLFGTPFTPTLSVYRERRGEYLAYLRSTQIGSDLAATRSIGRGTTLRIGYTYEFGRTVAEPALLCAVFSRCDEQSQRDMTARYRPLAVAGAAVTRIRTDQPIDPQRGTVMRAEFRRSSQPLGSARELQFNKLWTDGTVFTPLAGGVLSARVRFGLVLGESFSLDAPGRFIPPQERLYAGGAGSVRGFQQNELGALVYITSRYDTLTNGGQVTFADTNSVRPERVVPAGGNSLVVGNIEFRFRNRWFPTLVQHSVFADVGEVWNRGGWREGLGFEHFKVTPGAGLRVFTPVGPMQMNVAYNPYSRPAGPAYFDAPVDRQTGRAPLYCVSPGNQIPVELDPEGGPARQAGAMACPATYRPQAAAGFLRRLTFTFSIGPEF